MMLGQMLVTLSQIDEWLDDQVSAKYKSQPMAQDWARISKIGEELGEVISAWIIHTGQNPRKAQAPCMDEVLNELADVACTALLCMQHFTKDTSTTGVILVDKVQAIAKRMTAAKVAARH